jgi:ribose 5-phosphate isomerase B
LRIAVGCDHAGLAVKATVMSELRGRDLEVIDCGTDGPEAVDYPDFAGRVAALVACGDADRGVLMCGTGIGMGMAANRYRGVRAAVVHDAFTAEMSRRHNDANVLCLGGRVLPPGLAAELVRLWLETPFENGRHSSRVEKIELCSSGAGDDAGEAGA